MSTNKSSSIDSARVAKVPSNKKAKEERVAFALRVVAERGGANTPNNAHEKIRHVTGLLVRTAPKRLPVTGTKSESSVVIPAISNLDFGVKTMEFQKLRIDELMAAHYNPRKKLKPGDREFEKIKNSITEFGYADPIIVNRDRTIIGGHQRIAVLQSMGITEIECVIIDLDKTKEKALNVALNQIRGEWNKELLAELMMELQSLDYDVTFTGFDPPEIEQLFNDVHRKEIKEDDFDVDQALREPTISKRGDVWRLGKHRLVCGDSTDETVYRVLMDGQKANLVVTDPPYNVNYSAQAGRIQNDHLASEDFYSFLFRAFSNMHTWMEKDASIYVFHADTEGYNFRRAFEEAGFYLSGVCIWAKQSLVLGRSPYQWKHEPVLYGWRKDGKHNWYADRKQSTVWNFDRPTKNDLHPTMKPVALCAYPIQNSSMSHCIVLDPFGGSGSTLMACEQTNRQCYTIELDEAYTDVIVKRYIDLVGSTDHVVLERDGQTYAYSDVAHKT